MKENEVFNKMKELEDDLNSHQVFHRYFTFLASCPENCKDITLNPFQQDRLFYKNRIVDGIIKEGVSNLNVFVSCLCEDRYVQNWDVQDIIGLMQEVKTRIKYILDVYKSQPEIQPTTGMIKDQRAAYIKMQAEMNNLIGKVQFYYRQKEFQKQE